MMKQLLAGLAAALLLATAPAQASNYRLDFTASDFRGPGDGPSPVAPIQGAFEFSYDSFGTADPAITAVDLEIDGHVYAVSDISTFANRSLWAFGGAQQLVSGTNDFQLFYSVNVIWFAFTSPLREGVWMANTVDTNLTVLPAVVPEPETYAMLLLGLGVIGATLRRRRSA